MSAWIEAWKLERGAGTPIIALATPDVPAAAALLAGPASKTSPVVVWSCSAGFTATGPEGPDALEAVTKPLGGMAPESVANLGEALIGARGLPAGGVLVVVLAHMHWSTPIVRCALSSLRDAYKQDGRTLTLLAPDVADLPREVASDVRVLREPLPSRAERGAIVTATYGSVDGLPPLDDATVGRAMDATAGLTAFAVEQAVAVSMTASGLAIPTLRATSRETINARKGLRISDERTTWRDVGGLGAISGYVDALAAGPDRFSCVVCVDEIEKGLAGSGGGDLSGTSADQLGALLTWMELKKVHGILLMGPPGSGKSLSAQAAAGTHGVPLIWMDIGAMKGSLVGETGANTRAALDTIDAVSEGRALLVATCNGVQELRPELLRRFKPRFMVDLPAPAMHEEIWRIQLAAHGLDCPSSDLPDTAGWTGAEIRDACKIARATASTPKAAARYIVPISVSSEEAIKRVRREATNRFICATGGGPYKGPDVAPVQASPAPAGRRRIATRGA